MSLLLKGIGSASASGGGGGGPGPRRYWRVEITNAETGNIANIIEIQMYDEPTGFGTNILTGGTESASSELSASHSDDNAIDGVIGSGVNVAWQSADVAPPHWWKYDFGGGNDKEVMGFSMCSGNSEDFTLQYSDDDTNWTTLITVTGALHELAGAGFDWRRYLAPGVASYTGSPHGSHQHWRIRCVEDDGGTISSASEIEFRATPGGGDQATGGTAIENGHTSTFVVANAFDNNNSTFFASTTSGSGTYCGYSFTGPVEVAEITWRNRGDTAANQAPKTAIVEYAESASGPWTYAWAINGQTGWTLGQTRTFTDPRYI